MATQPVPERIVGEDYAAAILSQEHDCSVASEPVEVRPGTAVWKMRVRRPDGTDVIAHYSLALTGRKNRPETNRTTGTLIGKEHVARDRETGERMVKGVAFWFEPYWTWRVIPAVVPTSQLDHAWRSDGEADPAQLLGHVEFDMARLAKDFVERCVTAGIAGSMVEIRRTPISFIINEKVDRIYGVYIDRVCVTEDGPPTYTFRTAAVTQVDREMLPRINSALHDQLLERRATFRSGRPESPT